MLHFCVSVAGGARAGRRAALASCVRRCSVLAGCAVVNRKRLVFKIRLSSATSFVVHAAMPERAMAAVVLVVEHCAAQHL